MRGLAANPLLYSFTWNKSAFMRDLLRAFPTSTIDSFISESIALKLGVEKFSCPELETQLSFQGLDSWSDFVNEVYDYNSPPHCHRR